LLVMLFFGRKNGLQGGLDAKGVYYCSDSGFWDKIATPSTHGNKISHIK